eukprot:m.187748 g.187748  ORF g.187748 m.187748 type:complete len:235 (-) comp10019_c0_seq1:19-723(-)
MVQSEPSDCPPPSAAAPEVNLEEIIHTLLLHFWVSKNVWYIPRRERRATIALFRGLVLRQVGDLAAMQKYEAEIPLDSKLYLPRDFRRAVRAVVINCRAAVLSNPERVTSIPWDPAQFKLTHLGLAPWRGRCKSKPDPRTFFLRGVDDAAHAALMKRFRKLTYGATQDVLMIRETDTKIEITTTLSKEDLVRAANIPDIMVPYVCVLPGRITVVSYRLDGGQGRYPNQQGVAGA